MELALYLLLSWEVIGLVLGIAQSVANAAGKQFEIFSLILLRHSFEEWRCRRLPYYSAALGLAAAVFALGLALACNRFAPVMRRVPRGEGPPQVAA